MSAIFGIINKNNDAVDELSINKIKQALAHRATDGEGLWHQGNVAMGFCKLIVYPQQQNEILPIQANDVILTADARIDNRCELYSKLSLDKQEWQHQADSYLILKAYQKWGENCVDHLEGEYVFAIWNKVSQQLFMATDHIGFRPVFYYDGPNQFIFCSEIKGVVAAKTTPNYFNEEHLIEYHFRQREPEKTYNKEVFALCGGNMLKLDSGRVEFKKYWELKKTGRYNFTKEEDWIACFKDLLFKSVEKRLNTNVPIGVTLSGGLDSTTIACILSQLLAKKNRPLYAFSSVLPIDYQGIEQDERKYIEIVNKFCPNIIQTYVEAPGLGPFTDIEACFEKDEGIPNPFFYVDQAILNAASEKQIRSLFTGFGGDFLVSWKGNTVIHTLINNGDFKTAFRLLKSFSHNEDTSVMTQLKIHYARNTKAWNDLSRLLKRNNNDGVKTHLLPDFIERYKSILESPDIKDHNVDIKNQIKSGIIGRLTGLFTNRNSWYGMASCDPLFDKAIFEFLIEIPLPLFVKNGHKRGLLRYAIEGLVPPEIQWRTDKMPYIPDHSRRILQNKAILSDILNNNDQSFIFKNYISKNSIQASLATIVPQGGFSSFMGVTSIRLAQAIISDRTLNYLKENNYLF